MIYVIYYWEEGPDVSFKKYNINNYFIRLKTIN